MKVFKNKNFVIIFGLSLGLLILTALAVYLKVAEIATPLIVHFDIYEGIDFLGNRIDIFNILIITLIILLINFILAVFFFDRQRFLSFVFAYVSLAISILILIAISVIISIN